MPHANQKAERKARLFGWCEWRDSNSRPLPWQGSALNNWATLAYAPRTGISYLKWRAKINLVDSPRELSKHIFSDLQILYDRLEQLEIEAIMEADDDV